jgi:putative DNA primase/helicase
MAKIYDFDESKSNKTKMTADDSDLPEDENQENQDDSAPPFSEEALALNFAEQQMQRVRYVGKWKEWLVYDGKCWQFDDKRQVFNAARDICRQAARQLTKPGECKAIASAKTRAAVVSLASDDQRLAAGVDQWDANPWLINTPHGVVDLRTGKIREHRADDYMTKCTAVSPDPHCPTPIWTRFLDRVTDGSKELQNYLARVCGYSLTGDISEHAMFFLFGNGRNGKGVLMNTVARIYADYHVGAPAETFMATKNEQHPTELARLCGARLVTVTETPEGRHWNETRIKEVTGGDQLHARFMNKNFFDFWPQFKLIVSGNHKPALRTVDEAMKARVNLIPFEVFILAKDRDPHLADKLRAEWPGIMAWMVKGCLDWQRKGLAPPKIIVDATAEYLDAEDTIQQWINDRCIVGKNHWVAFDQLFASWKSWAEERRLFVISSTRFQERLKALKFLPDKQDGVRGRKGLTLKRLVASTGGTDHKSKAAAVATNLGGYGRHFAEIIQNVKNFH